MTIYKISILLSSLSFFAYALSYLTSSHMKDEFKRFGMEKLGLLTIILQFMGATGLLIGLFYKPLIIISSLGLALMMLVAVVVRIKLKDSLLVSLPALFYLGLNIYIFLESVIKNKTDFFLSLIVY